MALFDVHAHLTHPKIADTIDQVVDHARAAGVGTIISNGLNPEDNEAVKALANEMPDLVRPAFGLYPVDAVMPELLAKGVDYPRAPSEVHPDDAVEWVRENIDGAIAVRENGLLRFHHLSTKSRRFKLVPKDTALQLLHPFEAS